MDVDQWLDNMSDDERAALYELLAIGVRQLDASEFGDTDMEKLLAEGRLRRAGAIAAE